MPNKPNSVPRPPKAPVSPLQGDLQALVYAARAVRRIGHRQSESLAKVIGGKAALCTRLEAVLDELVRGGASDEAIRAIGHRVTAHIEERIARRAGPASLCEAVTHEVVVDAVRGLTLAQMRRNRERTATRGREVIAAANGVVDAARALSSVVTEQDEAARLGGQQQFRFARA